MEIIRCPESPRNMSVSSPRGGVVRSPFSVASMVATSPSSDIRKRSVSLAENCERNTVASLDNFQARLSKYFTDNEKIKSVMKNDVDQVKQDIKKKDEEIDSIRNENVLLKTRIEDLQSRLSENEQALISVKYENDTLVNKNVKLERKIQELETSMAEMNQVKNSIIQSQNDQFASLCKQVSEREESVMELYKKQLVENQQLQVRSQQLHSKLKHNLKDLANLTNLVSNLQLESVKTKKEYESSIQQLRTDYMKQMQDKMAEVQKTNNLPHSDFSLQKALYENQIISLKKDLQLLQDQYENHRRLSKDSKDSLLKALSERSNELSSLKSVVTSLNDQIADLKSQLEQRTRDSNKEIPSTHLQIIIPPSPSLHTALSTSTAVAAAAPRLQAQFSMGGGI